MGCPSDKSAAICGLCRGPRFLKTSVYHVLYGIPNTLQTILGRLVFGNSLVGLLPGMQEADTPVFREAQVVLRDP